MGSYRAPADRAFDQSILTFADCPVGLPAVDDKGRANWLAEGETITYWTRLPHGAARRIASAATHASVDSKGRVSGTYDIGDASLTKLTEGIVSWSLTDGAGRPVLWDPRQASTLFDGLPDFVLGTLAARIGNGEPEAPVEAKSGPPEPEDADDGDRSPNA
jgi:hypothetical protein